MCVAHTRSDCGNFATRRLEFENEEAQQCKDTQHTNICTALYEIGLRSVNKLEALSLSLGISSDKKSILDTESLKIVTVLINYKHLHLYKKLVHLLVLLTTDT